MARKKAKAKRANNEGSIYQNKNGLWIAQTTAVTTRTGNKSAKPFQAKRVRKLLRNLRPIFQRTEQENKLYGKKCRLKGICTFG